MTISYQFNVHTASFAGFAKLLLKWKGSVYKFVIKETIVFGVLYGVISVVYRFALTEPQRRSFENVARHIGDNKNLIPLTFVLGFYVQFVVGRWWEQYLHYPWPDRLLSLIITYISGADEKSRMIRRTLARWICLSGILLTRGVSVVAKKRFPTLDHLVTAGLMNKEEKQIYENVTIPYAKFWVPMLWFTELLKNAKKHKQFEDPFGVSMKHFLDEIALLRSNQWKIWSFDWVSVPLVYTQVITLATYTYFLGAIFSRQFLDPQQKYESFYVDFYFPAFAFLQFIFYIGWLKVAEALINPWGEDDDDFEVNWFIDRHVQVSFMVVDEKFGQLPLLVKDAYWNKTEVKVPYTSQADMARRMSVDNIGSTMHLNIPQKEQEFLLQQTDAPPQLPSGILTRIMQRGISTVSAPAIPFVISPDSAHHETANKSRKHRFSEKHRRRLTPIYGPGPLLATVTSPPIEEQAENISIHSSEFPSDITDNLLNSSEFHVASSDDEYDKFTS